MADQSFSVELSDDGITLNDFSSTENSPQQLKNRLSQLVRLNQLQKSIVRQNMHNAMSPLSAISGYLELINMTLEHDASVDQIEHYRRKIEHGVTEVNEILQQLNSLYEQEQMINEMGEDFLDVDLNWAIREVCHRLERDESKLTFAPTEKPLHVNTALYTSKLIIYKLITFALKCIKKDEQVELHSSEEEGMATLKITFNISENKEKDIREVLSCRNEVEEYACAKDNSLKEGLLASHKLASQIGGFLRFKMVDDGKGRMSLSLPSA
ncbi:MAG: hypothetical protein CL666_01805 [Balneola sp.]|nr:hypothetical protein [Balneola sp.]|tara:strand:+ start:29098 stop:29901 length:804 start_codon:yes stop_codon:yes gene_type:complete